MKPVFLIHAGAGEVPASAERQASKDRCILDIAKKTHDYIQTHSALDTVQYAVALLEDCEYFNAGYGAALQADGVARLSAAIMDGLDKKFGAIVNACNIRHPIEMARHLMNRPNCIMDSLGADALKRELNMPDFDSVTPYQKEKLARVRRDAGSKSGHGTVGAVALDGEGRLAAATSTGGMTMAVPGRVSDSCMPASTFATREVAISTTGIGEHIIRHGLAVRVATMMELMPQMSNEVFAKIEAEARTYKYEYGLIAVTSEGDMKWLHTTPHMTFSGSFALTS